MTKWDVYLGDTVLMITYDWPLECAYTSI